MNRNTNMNSNNVPRAAHGQWTSFLWGSAQLCFRQTMMCENYEDILYLRNIFSRPHGFQGISRQTYKVVQKKNALNPRVCWRRDIFCIIWNKVHRNSLFVFCKVVVITLQPALKIASIWILYHQHTLRQKLSLPKEIYSKRLAVVYFHFLLAWIYLFICFLFVWIFFLFPNKCKWGKAGFVGSGWLNDAEGKADI